MRIEIGIGTVAALLLLASPLSAQPPEIIAKAEASASKIGLADRLQLTLLLEGPAPLRVELPKQLLSEQANRAWRIRPDGPAAITSTAPGREGWRQVYRLDPYQPSDPPNEPLIVSFNTVVVNGRNTAWPAVEVVVEQKLSVEDPPMPVTPPEEPPTSPPQTSHSPLAAWAAVAGMMLLAAILFVVRIRRRRLPQLPPHEWALAALTKLEGGTVTAAEAVEVVSGVLRTFIERRYMIPAPKLTTGELLATATQQGWSVEQADALGVLLDECDRVKFAGDVPDDDGCRRLIGAAGDWIYNFGRPAGPG